jgi:3-hydroxybutyrate dehydrogenase
MTKRTLLITGAGSGIGAGLAAYFARAGFGIVVTDLDGAAARRVAQEITAAGGDAQAHALDVTNAAEAARLIAATGPIDVLINNAGLQHVARIEDFPPEKWAQLIAVMLVGPANLIRAVLPGMRAKGCGRIVNIGSLHALVASAYKSAYIAAKHGLLGLSKTIALETADVDITINTICPAYVRTPLVDQQVAAQAQVHGLSEAQVIREIMLKPMPKQAFVTIDEIAALAAFLVSAAARNITAQAIAIDGGWTAQ